MLLRFTSVKVISMKHTTLMLITVLVLLGTVAIIGLFIGQDGITASFVETVACYKDADCDDQIPAKEDMCRNPGTAHSVCVNKPYSG